jgi:uncharacterized coiled-coil protein SlyX
MKPVDCPACGTTLVCPGCGEDVANIVEQSIAIVGRNNRIKELEEQLVAAQNRVAELEKALCETCKDPRCEDSVVEYLKQRIEKLEEALRDIADYDDCDCDSCPSCIARTALRTSTGGKG